MDLLTNELQEIQRILYIINAFEEGNDEYLEEVEEIIEGISSFVPTSQSVYKTLIKRYWEFKKKTVICSIKHSYASILINNTYKKYDEMMRNELLLMNYASDVLERYFNECSKVENYPDLVAAFLLTIKFMELKENFDAYGNEIAKLVDCVTSDYNYCINNYILERADEKRNEINILVNTLEEGIKLVRGKHV